MKLTGVQFVLDTGGKKTAVLIDLRRHGVAWENFYDALIAEARRDEPRVAWSEARTRLRRRRLRRA